MVNRLVVKYGKTAALTREYVLKRVPAADWATGAARTRVEGRVPEVLDDDAAREFRKRGERACPFWAWLEGLQLWGCTLARAVTSLRDELEEEQEWLHDVPLTRHEGTTVCVDVVEREDEEAEEGAGEWGRGVDDSDPLGIEDALDGPWYAEDWVWSSLRFNFSLF